MEQSNSQIFVLSWIEGALGRGRSGDQIWRACPTWVLSLNLDDSLTGGLCRALTDLTSQRYAGENQSELNQTDHWSFQEGAAKRM